MQDAGFERLAKIAGFEVGLLLVVHDNRLGTLDDGDIDLRFGHHVRADRVDVGAVREPIAQQDGITAAGGRDDDVLIAGSVFRARRRLDETLALQRHLRAKAPAILLVAAVNEDALDRAHLANGEELRARLFAGAEEADRAGVGPSQEFGGDVASRRCGPD